MLVIGIDPGYANSCGYAVLDVEQKKILCHGVAGSGGAQGGIVVSTDTILKILTRELDCYLELTNARPFERIIVAIELPKQWSVYKSKMAAKKGILIHLGFLAGAIYEWAHEYGAETRLVTVNEWKGQVSKEITKRKVRERYGVEPDTDHECDAIGIADYILRQVEKERKEKEDAEAESDKPEALPESRRNNGGDSSDPSMGS